MTQKLLSLNFNIKSLTLLLAGIASLVFLAFTPLVSAQVSTTPNIQDNLCQGAGELKVGTPAANSCQQNTSGSAEKVNSLIAQIINIFSIVVGVVAVIMIIVGGFRYITSGGDSGNITTAKNTILYAIIGLVIVALAQFIVKFVLSKVTTT